MKTIQLKQLHPAALVPTQATRHSACWDLYALEDTWITGGGVALVRTGWAMQIPDGHCVKIYPRSGLSTKHGIRLANCVGVIDADYRGEILVALHNDSNTSYDVKAGDRVAQFMLEVVVPSALTVVEELDSTVRGAGGFGSSGA